MSRVFRTLPLITATVMALAAACGDDSTPGGTTFSESTSGGGGSTSTTSGTGHVEETGSSEGESSGGVGPAVCPATHECVAVAPEGWDGPVVIVDTLSDDGEVDCSGSYPEVVSWGYYGLSAPPAECSCSCGAATGASCPSSVTARFWGEDATCSSALPAQYEFFTGVCNLLPSALEAGTFWTALPVPSIGGSCEATTTVELKPATFERRVTACGGVEAVDGCGSNRVCVPSPESPSADTLCIWQNGDHRCPAEYGNRRLLHRDVVDERACADCTCGDPVGLCDQASLLLYGSTFACNPPSAGTIAANGECQATEQHVTRSVVVSPGQPTAFCAAGEAAATGSAEPSEPVTVCCR